MSSIPPPPSEGHDLPEARGVGPDPATDAPNAASSREPTAGAPPPRSRRPRFLTVALVVSLVFGAGCWVEGCSRLAFFRSEDQNQTQILTTVHDDIATTFREEDHRARARDLFDRYLEVSGRTRGRALPLAAAMFVLGAALLALAARGLAGRGNTRSALMQVVAAQAVLVAVTYFLTRELWNAEADWQYAKVEMLQEEHSPDHIQQQMATLRAMRRLIPPAWLTMRSFASLLIVIALTRPRARAFFEAATEPVSEG